MNPERSGLQSSMQSPLATRACTRVINGDTNAVYYVHLLERHNLTGGENLIAHPGCAGLPTPQLTPDQTLARFTLDQPLASYAVIDSRVSHYVAPVHATDPIHPGHRTALLIGLLPYTLPTEGPSSPAAAVKRGRRTAPPKARHRHPG